MHLQGLPNNLFKAFRSDIAFDVLEKLIDHDILGVWNGLKVFDLRIELQPILDQRDIVRVNAEFQFLVDQKTKLAILTNVLHYCFVILTTYH